MMLVKTLLDKIGIESNDNREVKGISFNSKNIENGYIFIAKKGFSYDGNDYINEAFSNGALCVISDSFNENNIYYRQFYIIGYSCYFNSKFIAYNKNN